MNLASSNLGKERRACEPGAKLGSDNAAPKTRRARKVG